jgi:hypothetical protein
LRPFWKKKCPRELTQLVSTAKIWQVEFIYTALWLMALLFPENDFVEITDTVLGIDNIETVSYYIF